MYPVVQMYIMYNTRPVSRQWLSYVVPLTPGTTLNRTKGPAVVFDYQSGFIDGGEIL